MKSYKMKRGGWPIESKLSSYQKRKIDFALFSEKTADIVLNEKKPARVAHYSQRGQGLLPPGYLRKGYGDVEYWPFSVKKAVSEHGYRRGIIRATKNPAYNSAWRSEADYLLGIVYEIIAGAREPVEVLHFTK